jgi:L-asparaginase II
LGAAPLVRIVRSGVEESVHLGHVAVCDADGRNLASAGDPSRRTFFRSCAKPFQAAVSFGVIGDDLPDLLAAVVCASHNGEPVHVRAVRRVLSMAGLEVAALRTPPAFPIDRSAARGMAEPASIFHNCSGKHAGMLLACVRAGWDTDGYRRAGHPLQRRVGRAVALASGAEPGMGVDGCGVPVHAVSLAAIATAYARLATPERLGDLATHAVRATGAMRAEPYLVGGRSRLDTTLMEAAKGLVVKEGAEAMACAVDVGAGIGVALKVADGGDRAVGPALVAVLEQVGLLTGAARARLRSVAAPPVRGGGRRVGSVEPLVRLRGR